MFFSVTADFANGSKCFKTLEPFCKTYFDSRFLEDQSLRGRGRGEEVHWSGSGLPLFVFGLWVERILDLERSVCCLCCRNFIPHQAPQTGVPSCTDPGTLRSAGTLFRVR